MSLYAHQSDGVKFLVTHSSALLCDEMGLGKSRQVLVAAQQLFAAKKIDRLIVLAPAAVRLSWRQEIDKLEQEGLLFMPCIYNPNKQIMYGAKSHLASMILPVAILSYALLPQERHLKALEKWCRDGKTALVCDESSFCKNRTAKQTKGSVRLASSCAYRWLLTGTPIANSPLDLYGQGLVMANGNGPLRGKTWWQFRARYGVLQTMNIGRRSFQQVVGYQNLEELTAKFAPYILRREKKDCLDLPDKTYSVREVPLDESTWRVYQELKKEAMLALPDSEATPEPNAAVRLLRLAQITSGYAGQVISGDNPECMENQGKDISCEKLDWVVSEILDGELSNEKAIVIWIRWRRERVRLAEKFLNTSIETYHIFGGQTQNTRDAHIANFMERDVRRVLLAQPHAGGFGLTLTAASTAVFLSNDFSYTTRVQAEDRIHRIGQHHPCIYLDVLATGPNGQKTIDHHIAEALKAKKNVAEFTCSQWKKVLSD